MGGSGSGRGTYERVEVGKVSRSPEPVGSGTTERREVLGAEDGQVGDGLLGSDVGERSLVRVVEGSRLGRSLDGLGGGLDGVGGGGRVELESGELLEGKVSLSEALEGLGEVGTLLGGDLGGGSCTTSKQTGRVSFLLSAVTQSERFYAPYLVAALSPMAKMPEAPRSSKVPSSTASPRRLVWCSGSLPMRFLVIPREVLPVAQTRRP